MKETEELSRKAEAAAHKAEEALNELVSKVAAMTKSDEQTKP